MEYCHPRSRAGQGCGECGASEHGNCVLAVVVSDFKHDEEK